MGRDFEHDLSWEEKANINPLFAIMSVPEFKNLEGPPKEEHLASFYAQGMRFWHKWFQSVVPEHSASGELAFLDYGCGMGRLSNAAAASGLRVAGSDISPTQIALAQTYCPARDEIDFRPLKDDGSLPFEEGLFDLVGSYAVLQHIRATSSFDKAIAEICRVLKPAGVVKVQLRCPSYLSSAGRYRAYRARNFEDRTLQIYLRRVGPVLLPRVRLKSHNHWGGAGAYHSIEKSIQKFERSGVQITVVEQDSVGNIVWLTGVKQPQA